MKNNPLIKLAVGAIMLGVGFVVSMQAQRELIAKWATPCEDCDEEEAAVADLAEDIESFVDEAKNEVGE